MRVNKGFSLLVVMVLLVASLSGCQKKQEKVLNLNDVTSFQLVELGLSWEGDEQDLIQMIKENEIEVKNEINHTSQDSLTLLNNFVDGLSSNKVTNVFPVGDITVVELVLSKQKVNIRYLIIRYNSDPISSQLIVLDLQSDSIDKYVIPESLYQDTLIHLLNTI